MHIPLRIVRRLPFERRRTTVAVLLTAVLALPGMPCTAQVGFPGAPDEPSLNLRVYPLDTWSPRVGLGGGVGVVAHHLGRTNAQALLTFAPAQHEQAATLAWASANPRRARQYVLVDARGLHTNRDWFYGLGPDASLDARQSIARSALQTRIRVGQTFLDHRLLVQPQLGLSAHRLDRVPAPTDPSLSIRSQRHLQQLSSDAPGPLDDEQTGLHVGVGVEYATPGEDSGSSPGLRLQGRWIRYFDVASSFLRFDQVKLGAYGSLPLGGDHRLAGRALLTVTESRGRASVPYFFRPTLEGSLVPGWARGRFVDSDRLIGSALYRFPLFEVFGVIDLNGHLGAHVANVYDDVFSDASLDVTFDETLNVDAPSVPLRPSGSVGLHVGLPFRETPSMDLALGLSPEGVTAVRFTFRKSLHTLRRAHHRWIRGY